MKKIGLVTVLFNSNDVLQDFFKSVSNQSYKNYVLYLIDNSPSEETRLLIASLNLEFEVKNLVLVENATNIGVAAANNIGIKLALKEYCDGVIILNNDIYFHNKDLFSNIVDCSQKNQGSILAPKIYFAGTNKLWYAGGYFSFWRGGTNHFGYQKEDNGQYNDTYKVNYAPTCFVYVEKEVFNKIGYMDEKYFVYADDADFMLRAIRANYKILYLPEFTLNHKVSFSTGGVYSDFGLFYNTRNRIFLVRKLIKGWEKYSAYIYIYYNAFFYSVKSQGFSSIKKINKAFVEGFKMKVE